MALNPRYMYNRKIVNYMDNISMGAASAWSVLQLVASEHIDLIIIFVAIFVHGIFCSVLFCFVFYLLFF